jgi:WD40 repeat protein
VTCFVFTPNSKSLVLATESTLKLWDLLSDEILVNYSLAERIVTMDLNQSGTILVSGQQGQKQIHVWTIDQQHEI